jgi:hypothetical protein
MLIIKHQNLLSKMAHGPFSLHFNVFLFSVWFQRGEVLETKATHIKYQAPLNLNFFKSWAYKWFWFYKFFGSKLGSMWIMELGGGLSP